MTGQDLKNSILQLAIQGKLVEQREEEGTAKELLEEIRAEKERLIKKGMIKKEKPLPDIGEDEIPFDIPETWEWVRLGDIAKVIRGLTFSKSYVEKVKNTVLVLRGGNIDSKTEKVNYLDNIYVDCSIPKEEQYLQEGDCLIVASSGTKSSVGKSCYIEDIDTNVSFGGFMMVVRSHEKVNAKLISYHIKLYRQKIIASTVGYISNITNPILNNLLIPLPPLAEQKRIVEKIEELLPYVEEYGKAHEKLEELNKNFPEDLQKSILQYAIQGKLVDQREDEGTGQDLYKEIQEEKEKLIKEGKIKKAKALLEITKEEIPFDIPETWEWVRFGNLVNFDIGKTPTRGNDNYWGNDHNWISIADMVAGGYINETKEKITNLALEERFNGKLVPRGTLIMSFKLTIGRVSILDIPAVHNEAIISIYPYGDKNNIIRDYFLTILPLITSYGDTKGAIKGKTLNSTSLNNLLIPLPPLAEQQRIVEKIEELMPLCKGLER